MTSGRVWQGWQLLRRLIIAQHGDSSYMAIFAGERSLQEDLDEGGHLFDRVLAAADRDHIGVIVLASKARSIGIPHQCRSHPMDLVGGHLLSVARSTDHDAQTARLVGHAKGSSQTEDRIVIERVVFEGTVIDGLMPKRLQPNDQVILQLESGMVGAQMNAHARRLPIQIRGHSPHRVRRALTRCPPPPPAARRPGRRR